MQKQYKVADVSRLRSMGFRPSYQNDDSVMYIHRFPIYRCNDTTTIEGEVCVSPEGDAVVTVYDIRRTIYPPHYCEQSSAYSKMIALINSKIAVEMQKFGMEAVE